MSSKNSQKPIFIMVNGAAATGKTAVAKEISKKFSVPYFSKDDFRSLLVDILGTGELDWIKKLGHASAEIFRLIMERMLSKGMSVIIDQVFFNEIVSPFVKSLQEKYDFSIVQVFCKCDPEVAFKRYVERANAGKRNKGFKEELTYDEVKERIDKWKPAEVEGKLFIIDTTDFETVSEQLKKVYKEIKRLSNN